MVEEKGIEPVSGTEVSGTPVGVASASAGIAPGPGSSAWLKACVVLLGVLVTLVVLSLGVFFGYFLGRLDRIPAATVEAKSIGEEGAKMAAEEKRLAEESAKVAAEEKRLAVRLAEEAEKKALEVRKVEFKGVVTLPGGVKLEMVKVGKGSFTMGSPEGEEGRFDDETQHRVTLTKDFWLGKYEVTQAQWEAVMGNNPSYFKNGGNHPVEQVSWEDAQKFCKKLNERYSGKLPSGYRFGLPTEAQWEYACRGGNRSSGYMYSGSNDADKVAWYYENSGDSRLDDDSRNVKELKPNNNRTHPVGGKSPNELGLYDMSGNVWEWCEDWKGSYGGDGVDPRGPDSGSRRVVRGGCWARDARRCRSADRSYFEPTDRDINVGFRLALGPIH